MTPSGENGHGAGLHPLLREEQHVHEAREHARRRSVRRAELLTLHGVKGPVGQAVPIHDQKPVLPLVDPLVYPVAYAVVHRTPEPSVQSAFGDRPPPVGGFTALPHLRYNL